MSGQSQSGGKSQPSTQPGPYGQYGQPYQYNPAQQGSYYSVGGSSRPPGGADAPMPGGNSYFNIGLGGMSGMGGYPGMYPGNPLSPTTYGTTPTAASAPGNPNGTMGYAGAGSFGAQGPANLANTAGGMGFSFGTPPQTMPGSPTTQPGQPLSTTGLSPTQVAMGMGLTPQNTLAFQGGPPTQLSSMMASMLGYTNNGKGQYVNGQGQVVGLV